MATINPSVLSLAKDTSIPYSSIEGLNNSAFTLRELVQQSFRNIGKNTDAVKTLIDVATNIEVSSGPKKLELSKIKIASSDGLFINNGNLVQLPIVKTLVNPVSVTVHGKGDSFITHDESGLELEKPLVFYPSDLSSGMEFRYQDNGLISLSLDFTFNRDSLISIIELKVGNSYSGQQTAINSITLNDSRTIRFRSLRNGGSIYAIFEEPVNTTQLNLRLSSSAFINSSLSLLKIEKISFGILGFNEFSNIILGPIGVSNGLISKLGISTDTINSNLKFEYSIDGNTWRQLNKETEKSLSISINTIFDYSVKIKTRKVFIRITVKNEVENSTIVKKVFKKYEGEDCYITGLSFGASSISNLIVSDYLQTVYDTTLEKFIYPPESEAIQNYRITMIPFNPVMQLTTFNDKYKSEVILNPEDLRLYVYGEVVKSDEGISQKAHFVYKKKEDYIPGRYSVIINGENAKTFDVYGDYEFSISRFIIKVLKTDNIQVVVKNETTEKRFLKESIASMEISDTEELISISPLFIYEDISYNPAIFYPFHYDSIESVTENGENIQNGVFMIPFSQLDYPRNKTNIMSIRDLDYYEGFLKTKNEDIDRAIAVRTKHKNIRNVRVQGNKNLRRTHFSNGSIEFIETKKTFYQELVSNSIISIIGIRKTNEVEIYTAGYSKKLIRVFKKQDIISEFNFFVEEDKIWFHTNLNNEMLNIVYELNVDSKKTGNMYSVDYENGVIYFSSYQNTIKISYEFLDMSVFTEMLVTKNISTEGILQSMAIDEEEQEVSTYKITEIPSINIGVI